MKKYNLSNIMKNAWTIRRSANVDMSTALKAAWSLEKAMISAEDAGKDSQWKYNVKVSSWSKYGKNRTYVETRTYTNAWNYKRSVFKGYVDNMTGEFIAA